MPGPASAADDNRLTRLHYVRAELAATRKRSSAFPGLQISAPVWNMLLDLYLAEAEGTVLDTSSLSLGSGAPYSTAMRYVDQLAKLGMLARQPDPQDRRRVCVTMTPQTRASLEALIDRELLLRDMLVSVGRA